MILENQSLHLENERLRTEVAGLKAEVERVRAERDDARAEVSGIRENCYYECVSKKHAQADIARVAKDFEEVADHWREEAGRLTAERDALKNTLQTSCNDHIALAGQYEAAGNTRGAMQLRAVGNMLGVILQGGTPTTVCPPVVAGEVD